MKMTTHETQLRVRQRKSKPKGEDACVDFEEASKEKKTKKIRNSEYYDMEKIFDDLYAQGKTDKVFNHLMEIIESEENIKLAYRNIKRNSGSSTAGVDHRTIDNLAKLSEEEYVRLIRKQFSNYHPRPVRRVEIEKTMERNDRLVFRLLLTVWYSNVSCRSWSLSVRRNSVKTQMVFAQTVPLKLP